MHRRRLSAAAPFTFLLSQASSAFALPADTLETLSVNVAPAATRSNMPPFSGWAIRSQPFAFPRKACSQRCHLRRKSVSVGSCARCSVVLSLSFSFLASLCARIARVPSSLTRPPAHPQAPSMSKRAGAILTSYALRTALFVIFGHITPSTRRSFPLFCTRSASGRRSCPANAYPVKYGLSSPPASSRTPFATSY